MTRLAERVLLMREAATLKMAQMARDLEAQGRDIVSLTIGEPDFDTPQHIKDAAKTALDEGYTKYTPVAGFKELREAIAAKFARDNGLDYEADDIVVSTGAKQSIVNVCLALIDPGDEVVFLAPYWVSYYEMARLAGGVPVVVAADVAQEYKVTAARIERALTDKTRLLVINTPCNPSGAVYTREELAEIAKVIARHEDLYVISDEIYEYITFDLPHVSLASLPGMRERVITVNGFSKGFAMTGWRLGYLGAPRWIAKATDKIQGQCTSGANAFAQRGAIAALTGGLGPTREMCAAYRRRKDLVLTLLGDIPALKTSNPQGAFYVFPDISAYLGRSLDGHPVNDSVRLCELLLSEGGVGTVAGAAFGNDDCLRISCAASEEQLREGVTRIRECLARLSSARAWSG